MINNLIICVNAVIPQAFFLLVGIIMKKLKVLNEQNVKSFTNVTFKMLYPFLMFDNLYGRNIENHMDWKLIAYVMGLLAVIMVLTWTFVVTVEKRDENRGTMIQAIFRSNIVLMGLPVATNLFGKGNVTEVAVTLLFIVPSYNILAVVVLEKFRGGKTSVLDMARKVVTNPIIIGAMVAIAALLLRIDVPDILMQPVADLSDATTPIAMVLLGASLNIKGITADKAKVAMCVIGKLIVVPALGIGVAVWLGFSGVSLIAITLMVASPTALASFAMASSMGGNGELAGEAVVFSTLFSCVTMPIWLFILKTAGLF